MAKGSKGKKKGSGGGGGGEGKKGTKGKKGKGKKEPKNKKDMELAKKRAEQEELERQKREAELAAIAQQKADIELAQRIPQLISSANCIHTFDKWVLGRIEKNKLLQEWRTFVACRNIPDFIQLSEVNAYLEYWKSLLEKPNMKILLKLAPELLQVIEELKEFLQLPADSCNLDMIKELGLLYHDMMFYQQRYLDKCTYAILQDLSDLYDPEVGIFEYLLSIPEITHCLWGNMFQCPDYDGHDFQELNFQFKIPESLITIKGVYRLIKTEYDHFSPSSSSYFPPGVDNALKRSIRDWIEKNDIQALHAELKSPEEKRSLELAEGKSKAGKKKGKKGKKGKGKKGKKGKRKGSGGESDNLDSDMDDETRQLMKEMKEDEKRRKKEEKAAAKKAKKAAKKSKKKGKKGKGSESEATITETDDTDAYDTEATTTDAEAGPKHAKSKHKKEKDKTEPAPVTDDEGGPKETKEERRARRRREAAEEEEKDFDFVATKGGKQGHGEEGLKYDDDSDTDLRKKKRDSDSDSDHDQEKKKQQKQKETGKKGKGDEADDLGRPSGAPLQEEGVGGKSKAGLDKEKKKKSKGSKGKKSKKKGKKSKKSKKKGKKGKKSKKSKKGKGKGSKGKGKGGATTSGDDDDEGDEEGGGGGGGGKSKGGKGKGGGSKGGKGGAKGDKSKSGERGRSPGKKGDKKGGDSKGKKGGGSSNKSKSKSKSPGKGGGKGGGKGKGSKGKSKGKGKGSKGSKGGKGKKGKGSKGKSRSRSKKKDKKKKGKSKSRERPKTEAELAKERERAEKAQFIPSLHEGELNLRMNHILGGTYSFQLLDIPPQPVGRGVWTIHLKEYDCSMKELPFEASFVPPTPPDQDINVKKTPEEMEKEAKRQEEELQKLVLGNVTLPPVESLELPKDEEEEARRLAEEAAEALELYNNELERRLSMLIRIDLDVPKKALWFEPPIPVRWDPVLRYWSQDGFYDIKFDERTLHMSFRTTKFGIFGLGHNRWLNLPYQTWELRPMGKNKVFFSLTASMAVMEFIIQGDQVCVSNIDNVTNAEDVRDAVLNKFMRPHALIKALRSHNLDVFPEIDSYAYVDGVLVKNYETEDHLYQCMAASATAFNFQWSRWNLLAGREKLIYQFRERHGTASPANYQMVLTTPRKSVRIDCTEVSPNYNETQIEEFEYNADLLNLVRTIGTHEALNILANTNPHHVETVRTILTAVRPLSFS